MKKPSRTALLAFILDAMPAEIKDPLIRDKVFTAKFRFKPGFSYKISDGLSVETTSLIDATRAAISGRKSAKVKITPEERKEQAIKLKKQKDNSVSLIFAKQKQAINIKDADVLLSSRKARIAALKRVFYSRPLREAEEVAWEEIAARRPFTNEEYIELMSDVAATPESLRRDLGEPQSLTIDSIVPQSRGYYERLLAPWAQQQTLESFIEGDLAASRDWILKKSRTVGLRRIAFSAWLHQLVPSAILENVSEDELKELLQAGDPISLQKLFGDEARTTNRCKVLCAAAVATIARLRLVFEEGSIPLFWFRLAALSHAGVVADALGEPGKPDDFLKWVSGQVGAEFAWHTIVDRRDAPRWEPDWISPEQLYSELLGRAWNAINLMPEDKRPEEWVKIVKGRIEGQRNVTIFFPGPLEDFLPSTATRPRMQDLIDVENRLKSATSIAETQGLTALVYLDKPSSELADTVIRIMENSRTTVLSTADTDISFLQICARLSIIIPSRSLADMVIDECVRLARDAKTPVKRLIDLFQAALTACAVLSNHDEHRKLVGETATRFAYVMSANVDSSNQLLAVFDALGRRDTKLIASLGRARAVNEAASLRS